MRRTPILLLERLSEREKAFLQLHFMRKKTLPFLAIELRKYECYERQRQSRAKKSAGILIG